MNPTLLRSATLLSLALGLHAAVPQLEWEVDSDRVMYAPGATASYSVRVISRNGAHDGVLKVRLSSGLDVPKEISSQPFPLKNDNWTTASFTVPLGDTIGGRGISIRYETADGVTGIEDSAVVATSMPQRWGNLYFYGGPEASTWEQTDEQVAKRNRDGARAMLRRSRATVYEVAFWAEDDFARLNPTRPQWRAGQCHAFQDLRALKAAIAGTHEAGAAAVPYINTWIFGPHGFDQALSNPEWFHWSDDWYGGTFDTRDLQLWDLPQSLHPTAPYGENRYHSWAGGDKNPLHSLAVHVTNPKAIAFHTAQVVESMKTLGWDGVRYDNNGWLVRQDRDAWGREVVKGDKETAGAAVVRQFRQAIEAVKPGAIYGNNGRGLDTTDKEAHSLASAERGGLVMEETFNSWMRDPKITWKEIVSHLDRNVAKVHGYGGQVVVIGPLFMQEHESQVDQRLAIAVCHAAGAQITGGGSGGTSGSLAYTTFGQRWAEILFDPTAKHVGDANKLVAITAPRPLWGHEFVSTRDLPGKRRQYVVHLVNQPPNAGINQQATDTAPGERAVVPGHNAAKYAPPPLVQRDVKLAFTLPKEFTLDRAICATPDAAVGEGAVVLTPAVTAGRTTLTVPRLDLWTMVILEGSLK